MGALIGRGWAMAAVLAVAACAGAACAVTTDRAQPRDTRATPATPPRTTPPTSAAIVCNGDDEANEDDDNATMALLQTAQLPGMGWTSAARPPCPWALSADELLAVPACREAATSGGAAPTGAARNGQAHGTFGRGALQLDHRVQIYTSRQNVDAIRAALASPSATACVTAALTASAPSHPGTTISDVTVTPFAVPTPSDLGLGFPATDGFAADPGFVTGLDVGWTATTDGTSADRAMRVVTFGSGGLMATVTLAGPASEVRALDLTDTLRAAAKDYLTMIGPG
jgi:hypothetical protein